jgi:hypothetical protein
MALAIHCDELIQQGAITDQSELARFGHVTTARTTQIMSLLALAPDIQAAILFLPRTTHGREAIKESDVRQIAPFPTGANNAACGPRSATSGFRPTMVRCEMLLGSAPNGVANKRGVSNPRAREFEARISDRRRQPSDSAFSARRTRERLARRGHRNLFRCLRITRDRRTLRFPP